MVDMSTMPQNPTWLYKNLLFNFQSYSPCSHGSERQTHGGHVHHLSTITQQTIGRAVMTRTRASAKTAGATFERQVADYLAAEVDDRIDRRVKTGSADKGDIGGVRFGPHRIVLELKNHTRLSLPGWYAEATREAENDGAPIGLVVHKRHGTADPALQWVTGTLGDLAWGLREMQRLLREANR